MPVRRFRDVSEMEGNTWRNPGDPELVRAIRETWNFARRTTTPSFPPGLYKHRSVEEAEALCEAWDKENFRAFQARREARRRP